MRPRSLTWRLIRRLATTMLVLWLVLTAIVAYEALHRGRHKAEASLDASAMQALLLLSAFDGRAVRAAAQAFERAESVRRSVEKLPRTSKGFYLDVWENGVRTYGDPALSGAVPATEGIGELRLDGRRVLSAVRRDERRVVRVAIPDARHFVFFEATSIGFLVLPLLVSFPIMLLPIWFAARATLRPVNDLIDSIERRGEEDLMRLPETFYLELDPLINALNHLMARLKERIEHEKEFLANAAHELKTPLAVIQANAEGLAGASDPARKQETVDGLMRGVNRATHAVNQLLGYARTVADGQDQVAVEVDLVELIRARIALLAPLAKFKAIEIGLESPPRVLRRLHRESMALLIDNVIDNALKYAPAGTGVQVQLQCQDSQLVFSVADAGPGIPAEFRTRVFERFYRIPGGQVPGTGLGLSMVEKAAQRNFARVELAESPLGGLLVCVVFPQLPSVPAIPVEFAV